MGERGSVRLRPAVFLDRDGVLNEPVARPAGPPESPLRATDVTLVPGAVDAVRALRGAGWLLIGVSNQPAAAKGEATLDALGEVHERVAAAVRLDGWEYCLHHPEGSGAGLGGPCLCRKPAPGMLLAAAVKHGIDLLASWMVGDTDADIAAGRAAGTRTVLVEHPGSAHKRSAPVPTARAASLTEAATVIGTLL